ncbi:alpha/beta fold hydrolase [Conexibacter sp. DBS9H8]|uniref:alpha/beta fold hydrolase n=1 Tax=Conexibacter sp. DBS9H8 TaxID=2937801 RepID=UPI00200F8A34|nr:alpha/beta hydrolase [Conexibacter sp. DBS9H8]
MLSHADWVRAGELQTLLGASIFCRADGPPGAPAVTVLHGFPTSSYDFHLQVAALAGAGRRVISLDLLGFGASDKPRRHRYSILEQADLVMALWRAWGITETAIVAHDYGVSVAQELLARDPGRVSAMVWLNGGLYPDLHRPIPVQRLLHSPAGVLLGPLASERTFAAALAQILGRPWPAPLTHELWLATRAGGGRWVQHRLLSYIDDRRRHAERWRAALEGYPGPTLCLWGPADPISGAHVLTRLRERLPAARCVALDDPPAVGHYPQLEAPEAVSAALVDFLG